MNVGDDDRRLAAAIDVRRGDDSRRETRGQTAGAVGMIGQRHFAAASDVDRRGAGEWNAGVAAEVAPDESRQFAQGSRHREEILFQFDESEWAASC